MTLAIKPVKVFYGLSENTLCSSPERRSQNIEYLSVFESAIKTHLLVHSVLKVVGNEKVGGSRRWHMIDISLGPW